MGTEEIKGRDEGRKHKCDMRKRSVETVLSCEAKKTGICRKKSNGLGSHETDDDGDQNKGAWKVWSTICKTLELLVKMCTTGGGGLQKDGVYHRNLTWK